MNIALTEIGGKTWIGGTTYLRNFSGNVKKNLNKKIKLYLISDSPKIDADITKNFFKIIQIKRSYFLNIKSFFSSEINKISTTYDFDVLFETTKFLGFFCNKKTISWMPDFQHKYYPEYFNFFSYFKREILFKIKLLIRDRILLSSESAKKDCLKFYKVNSNKLFVAPFSIDLNPNLYLNQKKYLKKKYNIKNNYFYIPNQFWRHKNHLLIFNFLDKLLDNNEKEKLNKLPEFIFTGLPLDNRNEEFSNNILRLMKLKKYKDKIKYLGLVPLEDVYFLNANCTALINPSFFEGWSTTVEEAKSLGTKMILSNIDIHKEQSPDAIFFNPKSNDDFETSIFDFINDKKNMNDHRNTQSIKKYAEKRNLEYSIAIEKAFKF